ncbi:MAG TPA: immune inhibitor A domain-containing protein, partial [Symbiobacteriaceae bacterium]|nr:immune inhibitor A domain-containing protein [Symbiobacteriaceae bacterium]
LSANYYGHYYKTGTLPDEASLKYMVVDGVVVNGYNTVPEVGQDITGFITQPARKPSPAYVGVYAHEFGHVLGLPDLYDYGYDSEGVGDVSLMAGGSYGRAYPDRYYSGSSPVNVEGWGKQYLSFLDFKEIYPTTAKQTFTLRPASEAQDVYRINIPGADNREYFVMENRQLRGFDSGLSYFGDPQVHGLVVYQVDETVFSRTFWRANEAQNYDWNKRGNNFRSNGENHYAMAVVQADGRYDLEHAFYTDAGDFFPGSGNVTMLLPTPKAGRPNTLSWYQWTPGRSITGIQLSGITENEDGSVTVEVSLVQ